MVVDSAIEIVASVVSSSVAVATLLVVSVVGNAIVSASGVGASVKFNSASVAVASDDGSFDSWVPEKICKKENQGS